MIDTHTHLNFEAFEDDWESVVDKSIEDGIEKMIVVGTDLKSSRKAVEMAEKKESLFASVGIHPHHARALDERSIKNQVSSIKQLAESKQCVAIGEVGLDYHSYRITKYESGSMNEDLKNLQKRLLGEQILLAKKLNKPLIIHSREAGDDVVDVIEHFSKSDGRLPKGVFHCFDGSRKYARRLIRKGFYISFTGNIVFDRGRAEVSREVPLNRLLLETDCPYMSPAERGSRSTPSDVKIIGQYHAKMRDVLEEEVSKQTTENARVLFNI